MKFTFAVFTVIFILWYGNCLEQGWKGIKVFQSSRSEVEKTLGKPTEESNETTYRTDDTLVHVSYSLEPCSRPGTYRGGFNLPVNTVLSYEVVPLTPIKTGDIRWTKDLYTRYEDPHVVKFATYENDKNGITVTTVKPADKPEMVRAIYFERTKEQDTKFACKKVE